MLTQVGLCLFWLILNANGAKVLLYQIAYSPSHLTVSRELANVLSSKGHIVDKLVIMVNSDIVMEEQRNGTGAIRHLFKVEVNPSPFMEMGHLADPLQYRKMPRRLAPHMESRRVFCEKLIYDDVLLEALRAERYDVHLTTPFDFCSAALRWHLHIPVQLGYIATAWDESSPVLWGLPSPPSYVAHRVFETPLSIWDRAVSLWTSLDYVIDDEGVGADEYALLKQRFSDIPSIHELYKRYSYIFYNTNEILDWSRPVSAKVKYIGGIAMRRANKLPEGLDRILAKPEKGNVVFSFGSLFPTRRLSKEVKQNFVRAFSSFPEYQFIWKLDEDETELLAQSTNIVALKWLPQAALLADSRVNAFISHMGLNSYTELAYAGKPVMAIPIFVDQFYNTGCALRNKIGVYIKRENMTTEAIVHALQKILYDPTYTMHAKRISVMMQTRPLKPEQEFLQYFEYALQNPDLYEVLQLDSFDLPFWKYMNLDIIGICLMTAFLFVLAIWKFLAFVVTQFKESFRAKIKGE